MTRRAAARTPSLSACPRSPFTVHRSRFTAVQHQLAEQTHPDSGRALDPSRLLPLGVGSARDVEMSPGESVDELPEEPARRNAAGGTAARILHVGDVGLHEL